MAFVKRKGAPLFVKKRVLQPMAKIYLTEKWRGQAGADGKVGRTGRCSNGRAKEHLWKKWAGIQGKEPACRRTPARRVSCTSRKEKGKKKRIPCCERSEVQKIKYPTGSTCQIHIISADIICCAFTENASPQKGNVRRTGSLARLQ